ncbi:cyclic nucleotide-binding domain-containing protein [Candidatus Aminicenantes bacterium AH-873-B07]|nr:cyclic nucleotide-binding domain-containing protein [Candidatus Aminicenantes bacterium AH-873-B07]
MVSIEELKKFEVFKELTDAELENIREIAKEEEYEAEERIFEEKSLAINMYLVLEGKVEIRMRGDMGVEQLTIDTVGSGEIFGWSAVTEPFTFTAAAWTGEKSKVLVLNGELLRDLFKKNNHIGYKIMMKIAAVISTRLRRLNKKFVDILSKSKEVK